LAEGDSKILPKGAHINTRITSEITRFVREDTGNRFPDGSVPYFDKPLVAFATASDPLFPQLPNRLRTLPDQGTLRGADTGWCLAKSKLILLAFFLTAPALKA